MRSTFRPFPWRELPPNVSVRFARAESDNHWFWIEVFCNVSSDPIALFNELHEAGFRRTVEASPLPDGSVIRKFIKYGSHIHGLCTAQEIRSNMRLARTVLRRFGFTRVPVNVYTQSDFV
jgi:hypothetical protein